MSRKDHGPETQGPRHAFDTDPPGGPTPDSSSIGGKRDTYQGAGRTDDRRSGRDLRSTGDNPADVGRAGFRTAVGFSVVNDWLLTPDEASARLRIAKQTLANWRSQGTGPEFLKQGGRIFYSQSRLVAWQEDRMFGCTGDYRSGRPGGHPGGK